MQLSQQLVEHAYSGGFIHCKDMHKHGCTYNSYLKFKLLVPLALKFYTPIHSIPVLIFKRNQLTKE